MVDFECQVSIEEPEPPAPPEEVKEHGNRLEALEEQT